MCLLIHQPRGLCFPKSDIKDFARHNPDGFGVAYGDGRRLHVHKIVGSTKEMTAAYYSLAAGKECVVHFRQTTHGKTDVENAHPYMVTPNIALAHNGVLSIGNPKSSDHSDTWHLVEYFIRPVALKHPDLLFDKDWLGMLEKMIGGSNRLAFAHADGRISVANRSVGVTYKTAWLSNTYAWSAWPDADAWETYGYGGCYRRGYVIGKDTRAASSGTDASPVQMSGNTLPVIRSEEYGSFGPHDVPHVHSRAAAADDANAAWSRTADDDAAENESDELETFVELDDDAELEVAEFMAALGEIDVAWTRGQEVGVGEWLNANPELAVSVIQGWYDLDASHIRKTMEQSAATVIEWLVEIATAQYPGDESTAEYSGDESTAASEVA